MTENEEIRKEVEKLEIEMQASPAESRNPLAKTRASIEKKIQSLNEDYSKNEGEMSSQKIRYWISYKSKEQELFSINWIIS